MSRRVLALAGLVALSLQGIARAADDEDGPSAVAVTAEDRSAIAGCLRDSGELSRACIGAVAILCTRRDASGSGETRTPDVACSRREAGVWRERLDVVSGAFAQRLDSGPRNRFEAVQRAWEAYTAQKCAFAAEMQQPDRAAPMQAACELREVAIRAIEVERLTVRATGPTEQRPRLQR